jgi:glutamate synthase (NADPH/NADH)
MIVGNVALYGATAGRCYLRGMAGERFCVRNSGAIVVVEGCGDHGCEYMTGGRAIILGKTGRNFGAGMSGGLAYVLDLDGHFKARCNMELIDFDKLNTEDEFAVRNDIADFVRFTGSVVGQQVLDKWSKYVFSFVKVFPIDLKRVMDLRSAQPGFVVPSWFPIKKVAGSRGSGGGGGNAPPSSRGKSTARSGGMTSVKKPTASKGGSVKMAGGVDDVEDFGESGCSTKFTTATSPTLELSPVAAKETKKAPARAVITVTKRNGQAGTLNKLRGFIEYERNAEMYRPSLERVKDWLEINHAPEKAQSALERKRQAARCMDCGTPFCQVHEGCPVNNLIPEFNSLVYADQWKQAYERLMSTNNFPEFTGRVCPAPCEGSCVAGLIDEPVTIKSIEYAIIDRAWKEGWVIPTPPKTRSGFTVAVIGSGPAGLACADQLNKVYGHTVVVFERADRVGGLLMYGIPNPKLEKHTVDRRVQLMQHEGVRFVCNADVGNDPKFNIEEIRSAHSALVLTVGACQARDLKIAGREMQGIHQAMEVLTTNTQYVVLGGNSSDESKFVSAKGKNVVVIGGGDTGADCIATSLRHGCKSVLNLELLPQPPKSRASNNPWPEWPLIMRKDYAHAEAEAIFGSDPREYSVSTKAFLGGANNQVTGIKLVKLEWTELPRAAGELKSRKQMKEVPGSERELPCDLVILALGFLGPEAWVGSKLKGLALDERSNVKAAYGAYSTNLPGVFAAGDCRRGQSLVVW